MKKYAQVVWAKLQEAWTWYLRRGVWTLSAVNAASLLVGAVLVATFWLGGPPPRAQALPRFGSAAPRGSEGAGVTRGGEAPTGVSSATRGSGVGAGGVMGRREYEVKLRASSPTSATPRGRRAGPAETAAPRAEDFGKDLAEDSASSRE